MYSAARKKPPTAPQNASELTIVRGWALRNSSPSHPTVAAISRQRQSRSSMMPSVAAMAKAIGGDSYGVPRGPRISAS
jgi:hypothetical protein